MQTPDHAKWEDSLRKIKVLQQHLKQEAPIGDVIMEIGVHIISLYPSFREDYEAIANDYNLMVHYMLTGMDDPGRAELYDQLILRTYKLMGNIELCLLMKYDTHIFSLFKTRTEKLDVREMRESLEEYVSAMTMLSLDSQEEKKHKSQHLISRHQQYLSDIFINIMGSVQWSHELATDMLLLVLSPTIDAIDAQLLVSAIMMGSLFVTDAEKVLTLMRIYDQAADEKLRQRALVGWVFCLDKENLDFLPSIRSQITEMLLKDTVREELLELQMQVVYCQNAERDNEQIRKEVMPSLLKNQSYEITRFGIKEKEEDVLEDILHPDSEDKKIEEIENSIQKIMDMQRQGSDIYFGGFSKMKRFGFFNTFSNWFMPFYPEHPQLQHLSSDFINSSYIKKIVGQGPFCDSDKYSFVLGLSSVFEQLPANIKDMLKNGEASLEVIGSNDAQTKSAAYSRRMYLQDLYRFFRINDYRQSFYDPFQEREGHLLLINVNYKHALHQQAIRMVHFLYQRKMYQEAKVLLDNYYDESSLQDVSLRALLSMKQGKYLIAEELYQEAFTRKPVDEHLLKGYAMSSFYSGHFEVASQLFEKLLVIHPESRKYKLDLAISYIDNSKVDSGVQLLFELNYKYPDDCNVKRALAWGLLYSKQLEHASRLYDEIMGDPSVSAADYLNGGYCAWFNRQVKRAAKLFGQYIALMKVQEEGSAVHYHSSANLLEKFQEDFSLLAKYGISEVDIHLMAGIASKEL